MKKTFLFLISSLLLCSPAQAQRSIIDQLVRAQPSLVSIESEIAQAYKTPPKIAGINPQTGRLVMMRSLQKGSYARYGAGVIVHSSGVIVTNAHNVFRANIVNVTFSNGTKARARIVTLISDIDVALLQITPPFQLRPIVFADSDKVKLRDEIITVGNSTLLKQSVSGGKVIGLGTSRSATNPNIKETDIIRTSINLYKGDSGGPLFDHRGRLVGLMTAKEMGADRSSFAISSNKIKKYLLDYLKNKNDNELIIR